MLKSEERIRKQFEKVSCRKIEQEKAERKESVREEKKKGKSANKRAKREQSDREKALGGGTRNYNCLPAHLRVECNRSAARQYRALQTIPYVVHMRVNQPEEENAEKNSVTAAGVRCVTSTTITK